jgi:polyisoprenoid-binding protein YceI
MSRVLVGIAAGVVALLAVGAGALSYLGQPHKSAPKLALSASPSPVTASPGGLDGTWVVDTGSVAGYRVKERFVNQPADSEAVARTSTVTGQMVLVTGPSGLELQGANFSADISKLHSTDANATHGNAVRDNFVARIYLETAVYPEATFVAKTTALGSATSPAAVTVAGTFTVHGVTHDVSIPLQVTQNGDRLEVVGSFQIHYQDYKVDIPSVPFTSAAADATVEVHLFLKRQG